MILRPLRHPCPALRPDGTHAVSGGLWRPIGDSLALSPKRRDSKPAKANHKYFRSGIRQQTVV